MPVLTRRKFLQAAGAAFGSAAAAGLYTWRWEPHWVEVVERALPVKNLPADMAGKRLVQLSDIHIGSRVDDDYLVGVFDRVRALSPEVVVYTGDFTSYDKDIVSHVESIAPKLATGRMATLGILGNHDYGPRWAHPEVAAQIANVLTGAGIRVLRNEAAEVNGLQIAGLDDLWAKQFQPEKGLGGLDLKGASIVLSHNPDTADKAGWGNYEGWILAGHTHGGQCKPPFLPPPILPVRNLRYTAGEFALEGGRRMYINRGVGHLMRVRFNARPEITAFRLERA